MLIVKLELGEKSPAKWETRISSEERLLPSLEALVPNSASWFCGNVSLPEFLVGAQRGLHWVRSNGEQPSSWTPRFRGGGQIPDTDRHFSEEQDGHVDFSGRRGDDKFTHNSVWCSRRLLEPDDILLRFHSFWIAAFKRGTCHRA